MAAVFPPQFWDKSRSGPTLPLLPSRPTSATASGPTRHSTCFDPSAHPIGAGEGGATPLVQCSRGPPRDARAFYSTTYSTTHNTTHVLLNGAVQSNGNSWGGNRHAGGGNGQRNPAGQWVVESVAGPTPSQLRKDRTGFAYNVSPYVEYDKNVDEGPEFRIRKPFGTSHQKHFAAPGVPTPYLPRGVKISALPDSGFTRTPPKFSVTANPKYDPHVPHPPPTTTMHTSYDARRLRFSDPWFDKSRVLPSGSAYLSNAGEIATLGDGPDERFDAPLPSALPDPNARIAAGLPTAPNTTHMSEDGYTRSYHGNILAASDKPAHENTTTTSRKRRHDATERLHQLDPTGTHSTSSLVHRAPAMARRPLSAAAQASGRKIIIGCKEAQGSVRNNRVVLAAPKQGQYVTETGERFTARTHVPAPVTFTDQHPQATGFTRGNKYAYVAEARNDTASLNRMQLCARKFANRGVCASKPGNAACPC
ncbi:hypothetical protein BDZ88DRAFT_146146 [Geranomyces variabilis]|nr:hypothetical protein BDZ88DRAFT_146146 [Geranomyces variabilis]KAJ3140645.1 hypothetical protein HDU90_007947 [Geranomyces variabilis]